MFTWKRKRHGHDRISDLPDEIIVLILSFLDMREAGRTCVLSKRWRRMWVFLPSLNFDAKEMMTDFSFKNYCLMTPKFLKWIDQVIALYGGPSVLEKFRIHFPLLPDYELDRCVVFAFTKGVRELELNLSDNIGDFRSEQCILRCSLFTYGHFQHMESLVSLCLSGVKISGEALEAILCKCPLLERLSVANALDMRSLKVVGSSLKLKHLELIRCGIQELLIHACGLLCFKFGDSSQANISYMSVPSLLDVSFGVTYATHLLENFHVISGFFSQLTKLSLSLYTMPCDGIQFPALDNLKYLELKFLQLEAREMDSESYLGLIPLLAACPALYKFTLMLNRPSFNLDKVKDQELGTVEMMGGINPNKLSQNHHLKVAEFIGFWARMTEVELAKYIAENAPGLEMLVLDSVCPYIRKMPNHPPRNARDHAERVARLKIHAHIKNFARKNISDRIKVVIL